MMNDMSGGPGGPGGYNDPMGGDKPITVTSVLKEFQGLKDKFKNEDEDDCESLSPLLLVSLNSFLVYRGALVAALVAAVAAAAGRAVGAVAVLSSPLMPLLFLASGLRQMGTRKRSMDCFFFLSFPETT